MPNKPRFAKTDVETEQAQPLYPKMYKSAELRWSVILRVYSIIAMQLLLTFAFGAVLALCHRINAFLTTTRAGSICCLLAFIDPWIIAYPLYYYRQRRPVNYVLLAILAVCVAFSVGLTCAIASRKVILEAAILTTIVVVSLTLVTFWAAKRGYDFDLFFVLFLIGWFMVMLAFGYIQTYFPRGEISDMIHGYLSVILFCGYIVHDTNNLIKRYTYDDYIWAAVALYLDVIYLFKGLLIK